MKRSALAGARLLFGAALCLGCQGTVTTGGGTLRTGGGAVPPNPDAPAPGQVSEMLV
jgi:hypothetical protein